ncbi:MAG: amidohydrolase family protein [Opitutae bacterium]|nr:amidohydrolase family protein [Opitutae bacterium]
MRIIDVHTHPVFMRRGLQRTEIDWLVAHGRALGIERMVTLGDVLLHGRFPTGEQISAINDVTAQVQSWYPDYFVSFCFLNPTLGERHVMSEVERCVTKYGFKGLKLEICNNASDACMKPVMEAARRWNLVVLQHSWSMTNIKQRSFHTDPADTALLARRHPDVKIIMAHLTGCGVRGVLEAKGLPNLYIDTSGGLPDEGLIEYAVEHLGVDHVLYGSDLPGRAATVAIQRVVGARLTPAERKKILYDNSARLLQLN